MKLTNIQKYKIQNENKYKTTKLQKIQNAADKNGSEENKKNMITFSLIYI